MPSRNGKCIPLFLLILVAAAPPLQVHSLIFTLPSGRVKCITEDLRSRSMSAAHYRVARLHPEPDSDSSPPHNVSVKVTDPKGGTVHLEENVEFGRFGFVAADAGLHSVCFWSPKFEIFASVSVEFEWMVGIASAERPAVVKKGKIDDMETELKKMEEVVRLIHEEMVSLREKEEEMLKFIEETNSNMGVLSFLSLFLCLSVASLQLWHLNAYFKREKIL